MSKVDIDLDLAVEGAIHAAYAAGSVVESALSEPRATRRDGSLADLFMQAEVRCEEEITKFLKLQLPDVPIIFGRRESEEVIKEGAVWVVSSLGRCNVVSGGCISSISIALVVHSEVLIGIVYSVRPSEVYTAVKGRGAFCNGQILRVSSSSLSDGGIVLLPQDTGTSKDAVKMMMEIQQGLVSASVIVRCLGSPAVSMCYVASGKADTYFDYKTSLCENAAASLILAESGGRVGNVSGGAFEWGQNICCGSPNSVTQRVIDVLKEHRYAI